MDSGSGEGRRYVDNRGLCTGYLLSLLDSVENRETQVLLSFLTWGHPTNQLGSIVQSLLAVEGTLNNHQPLSTVGNACMVSFIFRARVVIEGLKCSEDPPQWKGSGMGLGVLAVCTETVHFNQSSAYRSVHHSVEESEFAGTYLLTGEALCNHSCVLVDPSRAWWNPRRSMSLGHDRPGIESCSRTNREPYQCRKHVMLKGSTLRKKIPTFSRAELVVVLLSSPITCEQKIKSVLGFRFALVMITVDSHLPVE